MTKKIHDWFYVSSTRREVAISMYLGDFREMYSGFKDAAGQVEAQVEAWGRIWVPPSVRVEPKREIAMKLLRTHGLTPRSEDCLIYPWPTDFEVPLDNSVAQPGLAIALHKAGWKVKR